MIVDNRVILINVELNESASDRAARADYGIYTVGKFDSLSKLPGYPADPARAISHLNRS